MVPHSRIAGSQPPHELLLREDDRKVNAVKSSRNKASPCWSTVTCGSCAYRVFMAIFAVLCIFSATESQGIHGASYNVDVQPEAQAAYHGSTTVGGAWGIAAGAAFALLTVVWLMVEECSSGLSADVIISGAGRAEQRCRCWEGRAEEAMSEHGTKNGFMPRLILPVIVIALLL